jgi:hypothetical protein
MQFSADSCFATSPYSKDEADIVKVCSRVKVQSSATPWAWKLLHPAQTWSDLAPVWRKSYPLPVTVHGMRLSFSKSGFATGRVLLGTKGGGGTHAETDGDGEGVSVELCMEDMVVDDSHVADGDEDGVVLCAEDMVDDSDVTVDEDEVITGLVKAVFVELEDDLVELEDDLVELEDDLVELEDALIELEDALVGEDVLVELRDEEILLEELLFEMLVDIEVARLNDEIVLHCP